MYENEIAATAAPKRIPWNKGKLIGPRPPCGKSMSGPHELGSRLNGKYESWRCSISPSTASCGGAIWSLSGSMMLPPTAMQSNGRLCVRERPGGRCASS
jgi:hypothetical protein